MSHGTDRYSRYPGRESRDVRRATRSRGRHSGAALVESVLWLSALLFLSAAVASLGSLVERRQQTLVASRAATWLSIGQAFTSDQGQARQPWVPARLFDGVAFEVDTHAMSAGVDATEPVPFVRIQNPGAAIEVEPGGLALNHTVTATDVAVASVLELDTRSCDERRIDVACIRETAMIGSTDSAAIDEDTFRERVAPWVPSGSLAPLGRTLSALGHLPLFEELRDLEDAFGHLELDALPAYPDADRDADLEAGKDRIAATVQRIEKHAH